jgi:hypothetical protein
MAQPADRNDKDLLARLNALRPTTVQLETTSFPNSGPADAQSPTSRLAGTLLLWKDSKPPSGSAPLWKDSKPPSGPVPLWKDRTAPVDATPLYKDDKPASQADALAARLKSLRSQSPSQQASDPDAEASRDPPPVPHATRPNFTTRTAGDADQSKQVVSPGQSVGLGTFGLQAGQGDHDLDELLSSLALSDPPDDDDDLGPGAAYRAKAGDEILEFDAERGARKIEDLFAKLRNDPIALGNAGAKPADESRDDDSDAGDMKREVDYALSQAKAYAANAGDASGLRLPGVPRDDAEAAGPNRANRRSRDFENDIKVRMASLQGVGAVLDTDEFGMPAAPRFQPADRPSDAVRGKKTPGASEKKVWCIVCLEDATVRCLGCDNDAYCDRDWNDMHASPEAWYDARGHKRVRIAGVDPYADDGDD